MFAKPWQSNFGWRQNAVLASRFPLSLTSLRGWYDASVGTTIATGVSQWADRSGLGNNLVQGVAISQPTVATNAINGRPGITFDGNDFLVATFALAQPVSVLLVMKQTTWVSGSYLMDGVTTLDSMQISQFTATPNLRMFAGLSLSGNTDLAINTYGVVTAIFNGASSSLQVGNGTLLSGNAGAASPGGITLGSSQAGTFGAVMQVAEMVVMGASITAGELTSWKAYTARKYGI